MQSVILSSSHRRLRRRGRALVGHRGRCGRTLAAPTAGDDVGPSPAATFEVYKDEGGEFRWRLRARNTNVIATSGQGYSEKRSCTDAIESVKRDAPKAPVKEVEVEK